MVKSTLQCHVVVELGLPIVVLIWFCHHSGIGFVERIGIVEAMGVPLVGLRFNPRWIKAFWAWCIRFGQDPYSIRWWSFVEAERQREVERLREIEKKEEKKD